jgi:streptogramin lyase
MNFSSKHIVFLLSLLVQLTISLSANVIITEYPIGSSVSPYEITVGPDGRLWFTEQLSMNSSVGAITTSGSLTLYPTTNGACNGIVSGPDNRLWICIGTPSNIGAMTTSGVLTTYSLPMGQGPAGITVGSDGNLWFTDLGLTNNVVGMSTNGVILHTYQIPTMNCLPNSIVNGPDNNLWFTEESGNKIGKCTIGGMMTEYLVPTANAEPLGIAVGPDGNLWFTEKGANQIGKISISGVITEYPVPTANSQPTYITAGSDGNLWFTEFAANKIARITPSGVITEFPIPTNSSGPSGITSGPDGNIWFTEAIANNIGVLIISSISNSTGTFTGKRQTNNFGIVEEYFNDLHWEDVTLTNLSGYALYRNGELIAELTADQNSYQDHNRKKSEVDTYTLYPVNTQGLGNGISTTVGGQS